MNDNIDALEREYPELVGALIIWSNGPTEYIGEVVGCDYHVGVSIVNADDHSDFLSCIPGPVSKIVRDHVDGGGVFDEAKYRKRFTKEIEGIRNGVIALRPTLFAELTSINPHAGTCPFNQ